MSRKDELIKYLISKKFPVNYIPGEKRLVRQIQIKAEMWPEIEKNIKIYCDELSQKTLEEVIELYEVEAKKEREDFERRQQEYEQRRQKKLFFNQLAAKADFDYWSKMPSWTIDEAVALLLDKDPRVVSWNNISPHATPMHKKPELFAQEYQDLNELLRRKYGSNQHIKTVPSELIEWADRVGLKVPAELKKIVLEGKDASTDWKALYEAKYKDLEELKHKLEISQHKRKELVIKVRASTNSSKMPKMALAVIAKDKYKYGEDSNAIGTMLSCFARQGLNTDDKTLRDRINEGLDLLKNKKPN